MHGRSGVLPRIARWLLLTGLGLAISDAAGAQVLEISAADVSGTGWTVQHPRVTLSTSAQGDQLRLVVGAVQAGRRKLWRRAQWQCGLRTTQGWACPQGHLVVDGSPWGALHGDGQVQLRQLGGSGQAVLAVRGVQFGSARVQVQSTAAGQWHLTGAGSLPVAGLVHAFSLLPAAWQTSGQARWQVRAQGASWAQARQMAFELQGSQLQFSSPDGLQGAQGVALRLQGAGVYSGRWHGSARLRWTQGGVLWSPWYWTAPAAPVRMQTRWQQTAKAWQLDQGSIRWPGLGQGGFALYWPTQGGALRWQIRDMNVAMAPLYANWIKPLALPGGLAAGLQASGQVRFSVAGAGGLNALRWDLRNAAVSSPNRLLAVTGVNSRGAWSRTGKISAATLRWQSAALYRIPVGPLHADLVVNPQGFHLQQPFTLTMLGGALHFRQLAARWAGTRSGFSMSGDLRGVSMAQLTRIMRWPPFTGTVSATIPELQYHAGDLSTSGALSAQVFGGTVRVNDLHVENFFGVLPLLRGNVEISGVRLKPLTDAFHFGYISGVLDGHVKNLALLNWSPEAFDAQFHTVPVPGVRQEISYAAVQNLTRLGGGDGIGGFFQGLFLRMFKTFAYAHLGMGVRLRHGVAELSGVGTEDSGFVILQGQGLPRVDIVGYNRRVNWNELLARLQTAMLGGAQVQTGE
ncbi:hypothetical protein HF668_08225 [Acidithiobacillus ferridurans]|uniref:hypothetical protein n=1 Tax=Acidithiobacillus ferridurans TaxID=1232575 RepID=UPI001C069804|nr:hypothetical protein [Acidithiobacillus ferridurans]MBU2805131.1 hypothetical protein [Acidithiobacillus ferridurans]